MTRCQGHYVLSAASTSRQRAFCRQLRGLRSWVLRTRLRGHATTQEGRAFEEACGCKGGKGCEGGEPGDSREIASVCLLLRHFIHVTDNFCHLFCPFSQVVPWSSPAAPDFLSLLSSHLSPLSSALFSLCSPLSSPSFSLSSCVVGSPRLSPVFCPIVCSLSFPHVPLLSPLFLSPCCPSSLFSPRSPLLA